MHKHTSIDEFMNGLDEDRRAQVQMLRGYIISDAPSLTEHMKWNAPSYISDGEDRVTFNTLNKESVVKLVLHMGATRQEDKKAKPILTDAPLVKWISDIRGYMTFSDIDDITSHEAEIKRTIKRWLELK